MNRRLVLLVRGRRSRLKFDNPNRLGPGGGFRGHRMDHGNGAGAGGDPSQRMGAVDVRSGFIEPLHFHVAIAVLIALVFHFDPPRPLVVVVELPQSPLGNAQERETVFLACPAGSRRNGTGVCLGRRFRCRTVWSRVRWCWCRRVCNWSGRFGEGNVFGHSRIFGRLASVELQAADGNDGHGDERYCDDDCRLHGRPRVVGLVGVCLLAGGGNNATI